MSIRPSSPSLCHYPVLPRARLTLLHLSKCRYYIHVQQCSYQDTRKHRKCRSLTCTVMGWWELRRSRQGCPSRCERAAVIVLGQATQTANRAVLGPLHTGRFIIARAPCLGLTTINFFRSSAIVNHRHGFYCRWHVTREILGWLDLNFASDARALLITRTFNFRATRN
jgi:hypothetical protein